MLVWLIVILMIGGLIAWVLGERQPVAAKWTGVVALGVDLILILNSWINHISLDRWIERFEAPWIPHFGISFSFAMDGLSFLMLALTFFLGILGVLGRRKSLRRCIASCLACFGSKNGRRSGGNVKHAFNLVRILEVRM